MHVDKNHESTGQTSSSSVRSETESVPRIYGMKENLAQSEPPITDEDASAPARTQNLSINIPADTTQHTQQTPSTDVAASSNTEAPVEDEATAKKFVKKVGNIVVILVTAFVLAYLIRAFVFTPYEIPSGSMLDTIQIEDKVISERLSYYVSDPKPGDIVTFEDPQQPGRTLIKRVIATEGQTIDFQDGNVYVDGVKIDEPYLKDGSYTEPLYEHPEGMGHITYPYTVPEGHVWVMGDNRLESADSRYFGPVATDTVSGHAVLRYWPLNRFGLIE